MANQNTTTIEAFVNRNRKNISIEMRDVPTGSGSNNYETLRNKPSIESVTLIGDKSFEDLGLSAMDADDLLEILV